MILWEFISQQEPFPGYNRKQLVSSIVEQGNRPVISSDTPEDIAELILKCWSPEPKNRPDFSFISNVFATYNLL